MSNYGNDYWASGPMERRSDDERDEERRDAEYERRHDEAQEGRQ